MKSRFTDQSKPFIVWGRFSAMTQIPSARLSTLKPEYSVSNIGSIDRFCLRDSQGARGSRTSSHALEHPFAFLQKRVGRFLEIVHAHRVDFVRQRRLKRARGNLLHGEIERHLRVVDRVRRQVS